MPGHEAANVAIQAAGEGNEMAMQQELPERIEADFVVVGAGSAGCAVAARLSEDRATRVVLLEAGGEDKNRWIHIPLGFGKTFADPSVNWCYETEPDPGAGDRRVYWPRGKVLGGSSSINGMVYIRGPVSRDACVLRWCATSLLDVVL